MSSFSSIKALVLLLRTAPFVVFRGLVFAGMAAGLALATFVGAWVGHGLGLVLNASDLSSLAVWGGAAGFILAVVAIYLQRAHRLFSVDVAHVMLMVDCLQRRPVPFGPGQIAAAKTRMAARFGTPSALLALDQLVTRVIRLVPRFADAMGPVLGLPGLGRLAAGARLDLVILAHAIRDDDENAWEAAHDGLVLYTQNARQVLTTAAGITAVTWALTVGLALALVSPAARLAWLWPDATQTGAYVVAALVAWAIKASVIDPLVLGGLVHGFFRITDGQEPLPEWRGRLTQVSDRFRELGERALRWSPLSDEVA